MRKVRGRPPSCAVYPWDKPVDPESLFQKQDLSTSYTRGPRESAPVGTCACGDESSAAIYAWERNKVRENDTPILIEFEADPGIVSIDGRDFLYSAFQLGNTKIFSDPLARLFGHKVLRYAQAAWNSNDGNEKRWAMCDLAIHNEAVVVDHYKNKLVIGGKNYTKFRNAFIIKLPIDPPSIIRVWTPTNFRSDHFSGGGPLMMLSDQMLSEHDSDLSFSRAEARLEVQKWCWQA